MKNELGIEVKCESCLSGVNANTCCRYPEKDSSKIVSTNLCHFKPYSKECKFLYRPNENGLKEIISKQRQTISRLREEIKLLKQIKHIEFLKQITKERDALIIERIINEQ